MTARLDTIVQADAPAVLSPPKTPPRAPAPSAKALAEREARARAHEALARRWAVITEAGGIDAWLSKELLAKGFTDTAVDPSTLSDRALAQFKERKKAEAEARRALRKEAWAAFRATHVVHLGAGVHWTDATRPDAFDREDREARLKALGLPEINTPEALATALGLSIPQLRWLSYHREVDTGTHYQRWSIPKRDGTARTITAPRRMMKTAQRWALRNVLERLPVHGAAHGFLASRSIVSNAKVHAGADVIVKVDIKDFFPTVHWKRVKGLLRKAGYPEGVATLLALLATESPREAVQFRGKTRWVATGPRALPQGAPTSPAITNAICLRLDRRMSGLARVFGLRYTRYADDLTFSWRRPEGTHEKAPLGALLRGVKAILTAEGFRIHPTKTKIMRAGERQSVTGLVVNGAGEGVAPTRVPRDAQRRLRAALKNRELGRPTPEGETLSQLKGMAAFIHMTDPARGRALLERIARLEPRED